MMMTTKIRKMIEKQVFYRLLNVATNHGWQLVSVDGGDGPMPVADYDEAWREATEYDEVHVYFTHPDHSKPKWVFLVFGNDGWDLISDGVTSMEKVMDEVHDWVSETFLD